MTMFALREALAVSEARVGREATAPAAHECLQNKPKNHSTMPCNPTSQEIKKYLARIQEESQPRDYMHMMLVASAE